MCRIDYAGDGIWLKEPAERTAAKDHQCGDCGRTISKGERYYYGVWLDEGVDLTTVKMCAHCVAAGFWLTKVCGGHLWPGVIEELREHWDEEWDLRSHGLGRLVLIGEHKWERHGTLVPVVDVSRWAREAVDRVPASARH